MQKQAAFFCLLSMNIAWRHNLWYSLPFTLKKRSLKLENLAISKVTATFWTLHPWLLWACSLESLTWHNMLKGSEFEMIQNDQNPFAPDLDFFRTVVLCQILSEWALWSLWTTEGAFLHSVEAEGRVLEKIWPLAEYRSQSRMLKFFSTGPVAQMAQKSRFAICSTLPLLFRSRIGSRIEISHYIQPKNHTTKMLLSI